jgi:hypothetical protein
VKKPSSLTAATSPGLYGSLDGKVVAHGDAGNATAARMGTGEAHGDALAWLARCSCSLVLAARCGAFLASPLCRSPVAPHLPSVAYILIVLTVSTCGCLRRGSR